MDRACEWVGTLLFQRPGLCIKQRHPGGQTHGIGEILSWKFWPGCVFLGSAFYLLYLSSVIFLFLSLLHHFREVVWLPSSRSSCCPSVFPWNHSSVTSRSTLSVVSEDTQCRAWDMPSLSSLYPLMLLSIREVRNYSNSAFKHVWDSVCLISVFYFSGKWKLTGVLFILLYTIKRLLYLLLVLFPQAIRAHIIPVWSDPPFTSTS